MIARHAGCPRRCCQASWCRFAINGPIPIAAGRGRLADAAVEYLREVESAVYADAIATVAGKDVPDRVRKEVIEHVEAKLDPFDNTTTQA